MAAAMPDRSNATGNGFCRFISFRIVVRTWSNRRLPRQSDIGFFDLPICVRFRAAASISRHGHHKITVFQHGEKKRLRHAD